MKLHQKVSTTKRITIIPKNCTKELIPIFYLTFWFNARSSKLWELTKQVVMGTISKNNFTAYRRINITLIALLSAEISQTYEILRGRCGPKCIRLSCDRERPFPCPHLADYGYATAFYDRLGAPARFHQAATIIDAITIREMFSRGHGPHSHTKPVDVQ